MLIKALALARLGSPWKQKKKIPFNWPKKEDARNIDPIAPGRCGFHTMRLLPLCFAVLSIVVVLGSPVDRTHVWSDKCCWCGKRYAPRGSAGNVKHKVSCAERKCDTPR